MASIHVFVDDTGRMAVIPAPGPLSDDGPVFAGISPVDESISVRGFEIELDDDFLRTAGMSAEERIRDQIERQLQQPDKLRRVEPFRLQG